MKIVSHRPGRRSIAALAATGLVGGVAALLAVAPPASAAPSSVVLRAANIDFTQTRTAGHNVVTDTGVHVYTDNATSQAKAAGYFTVDKALADVAEPTLTWTGTTIQPGMQLVVDVDHNGTPDAILVGEPTLYGDNWWAASITNPIVKTDAPSCDAQGHCMPSDTAYNRYNGTLDQWRTAFPDAVVEQFGWSLGSGAQGDGLISQMTLADTTYTFSTAPASTVTLHAGDMSFSDTRTAGHNVFLADRLHVYTDDSSSQAKAAGYFAVALPLAQAGEPSLTTVAHSGTTLPAAQLVVDFDGNGTADGILVGEPTYADGSPLYGNDWWLSGSAAQFVKDGAPSHSGGFGSDNHGTLDQWRVAFPNAQIVSAGYSLGSGVQGDSDVTRLTVGTVAYQFANSSPVIGAVADQAVGTDRAVSFAVPATDANNDALTYAVSGAAHGTATVSGSTVSYTPAAGFAGQDSVTVTVSDGISTPASVTVPITVIANSSPVIGAVADQTTAVGEAVSFAVPATDANNDPLTYAVSGAAHGTATVDGSTVTYTPAAGFAGQDSVTVTVSDGISTPASVTVSITVVAAPLVVTPLTPLRVSAGRSVSVTLAGSSTNGPVTFTITSPPQHGTLTGSGASRVYTPAAGYAGPDAFTYEVSDGVATPVSASARIVVDKAASVVRPVRRAGRITPLVHLRYRVRVVSSGTTAGGTVRVVDVARHGRRTLLTVAPVSHGRALVTLPRLGERRHTLVFVYTGTSSTLGSRHTVTFRVI